MILIFDSEDKSGKSTLAKKLSEILDIPYIKLNNISIEENKSIKDGISISTHSQLETVVQLHEKGVLKDIILDRFHPSEIVYSNIFNRDYNLNYINDIEERLYNTNDVILIRTKCYKSALLKRWKDEKLIDKSYLDKLIKAYDYFYKNTKLDYIEVDTSKHIDVSLMFLIEKLSHKGISIDNIRQGRISHEQAMINMAKIISRRSPDISRQVGAILTEDGFIVGTGYNGPPSGMAHDTTDIRKEKGFKSGEGLEFSRSIHAEQNAIMQSGLRSKSKGKLELFCTTSPCIHCTRMLLQIGISKIVYIDKYNDEMAEMMWKEAGIEVIKWEE